MARVDISLNGRSYPIACEDGQEQRVRDIAEFVDERLGDIKQAFAQASDTHLLVMVSLMVADELFDLREEYEEAKETGRTGATSDHVLVDLISRLSTRLETLAQQVDAA